jgi:hypothetical protein
LCCLTLSPVYIHKKHESFTKTEMLPGISQQAAPPHEEVFFMSEVTSDRSKPTEAANDLRTLIESQPDHDEQVTRLPESSQATQPEIDASEGAPADDYFEDFREWCERRRTNWPDSKDDFLSDLECLLVIDIEDSYPSNPCTTKKDYSWVPNALWEIFNSSLRPETKLNILGYFLSLLSVLIISDSMAGGPYGSIYRDLLLRTVAPSASFLSNDPDYLGSLDPAEAHDPSTGSRPSPKEIALVRKLRYLLHLHASNPK